MYWQLARHKKIYTLRKIGEVCDISKCILFSFAYIIHLLDFRLSPWFEYCIFSSGYFPGVLYTQPLKMELIQGSETSANYNLTPGSYPEENIQSSILMLIYWSCELVAANTTELVLHSQKVVFPYVVLNIHYISLLQMKVIGIKMRDVFLCTALFI